ncbi:MAG: hypothetical protein JWR32_2570 [Mycobacterium sp.]|jgi:hypothetical protein|nr:hypothetical protein [Mycobacterium sp.]
MQAVRQRIVDSVDFRVGDQRLVAFVNPANVVFGGKRLCARGIASRHRGDHDLDVSVGRVDERRRCDARCAQDAYPQRGGLVTSHR